MACSSRQTRKRSVSSRTRSGIRSMSGWRSSSPRVRSGRSVFGRSTAARCRRQRRAERDRAVSESAHCRDRTDARAGAPRAGHGRRRRRALRWSDSHAAQCDLLRDRTSGRARSRGRGATLRAVPHFGSLVEWFVVALGEFSNVGRLHSEVAGSRLPSRVSLRQRSSRPYPNILANYHRQTLPLTTSRMARRPRPQSRYPRQSPRVLWAPEYRSTKRERSSRIGARPCITARARAQDDSGSPIAQQLQRRRCPGKRCTSLAARATGTRSTSSARQHGLRRSCLVTGAKMMSRGNGPNGCDNSTRPKVKRGHRSTEDSRRTGLISHSASAVGGSG